MTAKRKPWIKRPDAPPRLSGRAAVERRLRWLRAHPLCEICERAGRVTLATIVDHILMLARGGRDDESNFQSLCKPCHDRKSAEEKGQRIRPQIGIDGYPIGWLDD